MARRKQRSKRRLALISTLAAVGSGLAAAVVRRRRRAGVDASNAGADFEQYDDAGPHRPGEE